jgi:hypothetical protein
MTFRYPSFFLFLPGFRLYTLGDRSGKESGEGGTVNFPVSSSFTS